MAVNVQIFFPPEIPKVGDVTGIQTASSVPPPGHGWTLMPGSTPYRYRWTRMATESGGIPWPGYHWGVRYVDGPTDAPLPVPCGLHFIATADGRRVDVPLLGCSQCMGVSTDQRGGGDMPAG